MNLYLDDVRKCPPGFTLARTAMEAIEILKTGTVEFASLDHDLAEEHYPWNGGVQDERTGYAVVKWMEENNVWPSKGVRVHSMNPVGRARMEAAINKHYGRLPER